jgi:hypothetical protein
MRYPFAKIILLIGFLLMFCLHAFTQVPKTVFGRITTQNLVPTGVATANSAVEISLSDHQRLTFQVTGTYTGALSVQITVDGSTWETIASATALTNMVTGTQSATVTSAVQDVFQVGVAGCSKVRVTGLAAMTGTALITMKVTN